MKKAKISSFLNFFDASPSSWLFAPIFLFLGLVLISQGLHIYSMTCNRAAPAPNTCEIYHFSLSGIENKKFPLSQLKQAKLEQSISAKSRIIKVVLITEKETIIFGSVSSEYAIGKENIVNKINRFLQNSNQLKLFVKEPLSSFLLVGGTLLILIGLYILLSCFYFIYSCFHLLIELLIKFIKFFKNK